MSRLTDGLEEVVEFLLSVGKECYGIVVCELNGLCLEHVSYGGVALLPAKGLGHDEQQATRGNYVAYHNFTVYAGVGIRVATCRISP